MAKQKIEFNTEALTDMASRIAGRIESTERKGSLNQAKVQSPRLSNLYVVDTPEYTDKAGKDHEHTIHTEIKSPSGKVLTIRTKRDLEMLVYLKDNPGVLDAFIQSGAATLILNPTVIEDDTGDIDGSPF